MATRKAATRSIGVRLPGRTIARRRNANAASPSLEGAGALSKAPDRRTKNGGTDGLEFSISDVNIAMGLLPSPPKRGSR
jgi:hypothetical protein